MKSVVKKAECRIDLAGGTIDLWPLYLYTGGLELINMGINVYATAKITRTPTNKKNPAPFIEIKSRDLNSSDTYHSLEELEASLALDTGKNPLRWLGRLTHYALKNSKLKDQFKVETWSDAPPGSGLGGSSVLGVALLTALLESTGQLKKRTPAYLWSLQQTIRDLEAVEIEHPAGDQDYLPALFGGLNVVHLAADQRKIEPLAQKTAKYLSDRIAVLYTGKPHHSGINNWSVFKNFHEKNSTVRELIFEIAKISKTLAQELRESNFSNVPDLINAEWEARRQLSDHVDAPVLKEAWEFAKLKGAVARKGCGAGGGGCILFYFDDPKKKASVVKKSLPRPEWKWISSSPTNSKF